jgi:hypothetical protein
MAHHWYDEEIKPGDKLTFTDEVELHFADLGINHKFKFGDELVVVERDDERSYGICVADPRDMTWQAWVSIIVAERAQESWLELNGLAPEGERARRKRLINDWNKEVSILTPEERIKKFEALRDVITEKHSKDQTQSPPPDTTS